MPISTISSITPKGSFESKFGTMYSFIYVFADGTSGEASHKTANPPFAVGQHAEYTVTGEFKGVAKLKVQRPQDGGAITQPQPTTLAGGVPATTVPGVHSTYLGVTVGMALNNAALDARAIAGAGNMDLSDDKALSGFIWKRASLYLRAAQALELGKLAPSPTHEPAPAATGKRVPAGGLAFDPNDASDDVAF